jgi:hypothetical protein
MSIIILTVLNMFVLFYLFMYKPILQHRQPNVFLEHLPLSKIDKLYLSEKSKKTTSDSYFYCINSNCSDKDTIFVNNYRNKRLNIKEYEDVTKIYIYNEKEKAILFLDINISYNKNEKTQKFNYKIGIVFNRNGNLEKYELIRYDKGNYDTNLLNINLTKALIDDYDDGVTKTLEYNLYFQYGYFIKWGNDNNNGGMVFNAFSNNNNFVGGHILYENILPLYIKIKK